MTPDEIKETLRLHKLLTGKKEGGVRADFSCKNLIGANMEDADMRGAKLEYKQLILANLVEIKKDFIIILSTNRAEIPGLLTALKEGRVDGSTYEGECTCLVGTIAKIKKVDVATLPRNSMRPAERWFLAIKKGDNPENNPFSKITCEWIEEFLNENP